MSTPIYDVTGGEIKIVGNEGDEHTFRLGNKDDEESIAEGIEYEGDFTNVGGTVSEIELDITELATEKLIIPVTIKNGTYRVRRLDPRQTLLTIQVEAQ